MAFLFASGYHWGMKRILMIITIILIACTCPLFADDYNDVNRLIKYGYVKSDPEAIRQLSAGLSQSQKESLYVWNNVSTLEGVLFNSLLGFGSGSFQQKDTLHGIIFLCGDTVCTGLIIWNFVKNAGENINNELWGDGGISDDYSLALAGLIGGLALRVWQVIRPIGYARKYNSKLAYALNLDTPQIAIVPKYGELETEVTLSATISY